MSSVKCNKRIDDWVVITYCDHGDISKKKIFRRSYSLKSAQKWFDRQSKLFTCKGKWRIWQEDKKGNVINDSTKEKISHVRSKNDDCVIVTYCDYGDKNRKSIFIRSYSVKSAKDWFNKKSERFTNFGKWRIWQEDKKGNIINDSKT
jgi:S-adenosylmethionine hydrolase